MHKTEFVLENETRELFCDFKIQTDHLISARRRDLELDNKNNRFCRIVFFAVLADHRVKLKEGEKKEKYLDITREREKTVEHEGDSDANWISVLATVNRRLMKGREDFEG